MKSLEQLRRDPRIARLEHELAARRPIEVESTLAKRAAVAILVRLGEKDEPEVFFIQRAVYEGDPWSGQIAFPGGRAEVQDASLVETAIRETFEETEIDLRDRAHLVGALDDLAPLSVHLPPIIVRPFVFLIPESPEIALSYEVETAFWVPLSVLLDRSVWRDTTVQARGIEFSRFAFHHRGYVVWGMTENILSGLLTFCQEGDVTTREL